MTLNHPLENRTVGEILTVSTKWRNLLLELVQFLVPPSAVGECAELSSLHPPARITAALLFLTHKSTGPNKNFYCQNLGSRLGNFYKAPELDMKYPHLSSGEGKKH